MASSDQSMQVPETPERVLDDPERVTIRVQKLQLEALDALVDGGYYSDRSKAIRAGIELMLEDGGRDNEVRLENTRRVTFWVPQQQLDDIERLVDRAIYPSRSAAIRDALEYLFEPFEREAVRR